MDSALATAESMPISSEVCTDEVHRKYQPTMGEKETIEVRKAVHEGDGAKHIFHIVEHMKLSGWSCQPGLGGGAPIGKRYCYPSAFSLNLFHVWRVVTVLKFPGLWDFL